MVTSTLDLCVQVLMWKLVWTVDFGSGAKRRDRVACCGDWGVGVGVGRVEMLINVVDDMSGDSETTESCLSSNKLVPIGTVNNKTATAARVR